MLGEMIRGMEEYESVIQGVFLVAIVAEQEAGKTQKPRLKVNLPCTSRGKLWVSICGQSLGLARGGGEGVEKIRDIEENRELQF